MSRQSKRPRIIIVGGGFAGLTTVRGLARVPADVTLVDRRNHHLFQPLLYQVATAALSAPDIASPIRKVVRRQKNTTVILADVSDVDLRRRQLIVNEGTVEYDYLVLAAGAASHYYGHVEWERHAPGLKSLEDALQIRRRILLAYEAAEREPNPQRQRQWLTFVVIGGGPTGVELAGAIAEISRHTLAKNFRNFDPAQARVVLTEGAPQLLGGFSEKTALSAEAQLDALGVEVRTGTPVTAVDARGVELCEHRIAARTVLWAAGVRPSPLAATLGVPLDAQGRVLVTPTLTLPEHDEVFVLGDMAAVKASEGWAPGVAPAAIQQGNHVARNIHRALRGKPMRPFIYRERGMMAAVGRSKAVVDTPWIRTSGFFAWVLWLVVHIMFLIGFRNRVVVFFEWAWAYLSFQRSARIILEYPVDSDRHRTRN